jgi:hemerythrin-like metal-binding protein
MDRYTLPASCELPVPELQAEHQALIDILNRGLETIRNIPDPSAELFLSLLEDLRQLLGVHFAHEEQAMARYNFPHLAPHSLHHDLCAARLDRLGDLLLAGQLKPNRFLLDELFDMLLDDVIRADGEFKTFLEDNSADSRAQP